MIQPGTKLSHYEIVGALGKGGMGEVWRARDTKLGREVAIKTLPAEFAQDADRLARFEREAKLLASLNHPNIAAIYGLEEHEGKRFLVLELVEGDTLADRMKGGPVAEDEALKIAQQIAEAIEAAHEKGVIHRDLKPANIKITPEGKVKVLDFGLAKSFVGDDIDVSLSNSPTMSVQGTQQGVILGTAAYMSPEQVRGRPLDKRTDVWSFGVVLYEMLTGQRLFAGETVSDIVAGVLRAEPDWNAVPFRFRKLVRRCLERDPDRRLRHVGDIELLLDEDSANETGVEARATGPGTTWLWATVAVLSGIAIAIVLLSGGDTATSPEVFRSQIPQSEDTSFTDVFSVSPDGTMLAFIATTEAGAQIWIREFVSLSARPLSETLSRNLVELTGALMWSPDGRSLAYWRDGELRTIDASGESPSRLIAEVPGATSGFWGADNRIVFQYPGSGGFMQVADDGGEINQVTLGNHRYPSPLPDGRFLYTELRDGQLATLVGAADRDPAAQDSTPVVTGVDAAVYIDGPVAGTGHLLTLTENVLSARRFDPSGMESLGEPHALAADIAERTITAASNIFRPLAFSASLNRLVYRTGDLERMRLTWFDRQGNELGIVGEAGTYDRMDISPDGSQLVVTRVAPGGGSFDLWIYDLDGAAQGDRFTLWENADFNPAWSWPDGGKIAFTSSRDEFPQDVYVKNSDGTGEATLVHGTPGMDAPTSWSPDGRFLLVWEVSVGSPADIVLLPLSEEDGEARPFIATRFNDAVPKFSPDQRFVSFASDRSAGEMQVFVQAFDPAPGVEKRAVPVGPGFETQWREDGGELYYLERDRTLTAVEVTSAANGDPVLGERRRLFDVNIDGFWWEAAPAGDRFLIPVPTSAVVRDAFNVVTGWRGELSEQ